MKHQQKNKRKPWLGLTLGALVAGAIIGFTGWPFKNRRGAVSNTNGESGDQGAGAKVDVALTNEVAEAIQPKPGAENSFTNEGGTGNND